MNVSELVAATRSVRRFRQERAVPADLLRGLVDLARQTASAGNLQPLRYVLAVGPEACERIFPHLAWAAYLKDWPGPEQGERPTAYVVVCSVRELAAHAQVDAGIACQTMLLAARERGLGGCMIGSVRRNALAQVLDIPQDMDILYVLALGEPAETVVLEPMPENGSVHYRRDAAGTHHVPKRGLDEVLIAQHGPTTLEEQ